MSGAVEAAEAFAASSPETTRNRTLVWQDPVPTAAAGATAEANLTAADTGKLLAHGLATLMILGG